MASNAIRGRRVGSGPIRPDEAMEPAPRRRVTYWCANGHLVAAVLRGRRPPARRVGLPALRACRPARPEAPPGRPHAEPYKSHLAYVKERRSDAEGEALVAEALGRLRQRRGAD